MILWKVAGLKTDAPHLPPSCTGPAGPHVCGQRVGRHFYKPDWLWRLCGFWVGPLLWGQCDWASDGATDQLRSAPSPWSGGEEGRGRACAYRARRRRSKRAVCRNTGRRGEKGAASDNFVAAKMERNFAPPPPPTLQLLTALLWSTLRTSERYSLHLINAAI